MEHSNSTTNLANPFMILISPDLPQKRFSNPDETLSCTYKPSDNKIDLDAIRLDTPMSIANNKEVLSYVQVEIAQVPTLKHIMYLILLILAQLIIANDVANMGHASYTPPG